MIRENDTKGKVIAKIDIVCISEGQFRRDQRGQWLNVTAPLQYVPKGVTDLCIVCEGEGACVDWIQFKHQTQIYGLS